MNAEAESKQIAEAQKEQRAKLAGEAIAEIFRTLETHPHVVNVKVGVERAKAIAEELIELRRSLGLPVPEQSPQQLLETMAVQFGAAHGAMMTYLARLGNQVGMLTQAVMTLQPQQQKEAPANVEPQAVEAPAAEAQATS